VQHGARAGAADQLAQLNDYMYLCDKAASDMDLATWITLCGQGYRIVLPRKEVEQGRESDEAPFLIETLPPQSTFVVYSTAIGHRPLLGVVVKARQTDSGDGAELIYGGYTDEFYFEATDQGVIPGSIRPHSMGCVPIFEYNLNLQKMGVFEPALPLLDALDAVISNRLDSVEQFVQSYFRAINCELDVETFEEFKSKGMIQLKSAQGLPASFDLITQELNQQQVQTLTDYIYDQILVICGVPTTKKGGTSTSDTGAAVFLRDGWTQAEARARTTEMLFRRSERNFLRAVFRMLRDLEPDWTLPLVDVDFKFTRRQTDNLQNKTQALMQMLQAGIDPSIAIAQSGLFNDPTDVAQRSEAYLHKWEPDVEPIAPAEPVAPFVDGEIIAE
jgi:SPP1 family phage portal protein